MTALAEVSVFAQTRIGASAVDYRTTSLTGNKVFLGTVRAGVEAAILAERRFGFRQGLATIFTLNGFHRPSH